MSRAMSGRELRPSVQLSLVAGFSALTALLTSTLKVPSPTGGYTHIGDSMIFLAALLFGPKIGALVGAMGPTVADLVVGYPRWYVTVIAHGIEGYIAGLGMGRGPHWRAALCFLAGVLMALTYFAVNIFVKGFGPALVSLARDVFGQGLISTLIAVPLSLGIEQRLGRRAGAKG